MVVVCGKVNAVERAATKTTYHIEDHSGTLEVYTEINLAISYGNKFGKFLSDLKQPLDLREFYAGTWYSFSIYQVVQWVDEGSAGAEHNEGDEVKVIKFISEHV